MKPFKPFKCCMMESRGSGVHYINNMNDSSSGSTNSNATHGVDQSSYIHRNAAPSELTPGELLMAKEMGRLSLKQREVVYEDIHGVATEQEEQPAFVHHRLALLDEEVQATTKDREAYDRALFLSPGFCKARDFRLMFLRSDEFDPRKAASRIMRHFQIKQRLFGEAKLVKKIRWDDLSQDDQASIETGSVQLFPDCQDRSGRPIYFIVYNKRDDRTIENHMRCAWYLSMSALQNNSNIQRKGMVAVSYTMGISSAEYCATMVSESSNMIIDGLPILARSAHICFEDQTLKTFFSLLMTAGPKRIRQRVRFHFGSFYENQYSLNTFGIPSTVVPIHDDGSIKADEFRLRLEALRQAEIRDQEMEMLAHIGLVPYPVDGDVLLGRGLPYQSHPGTAQLMKLVIQLKPSHSDATRAQKTSMCEEVVRAIKAKGGRFLKRDEDDYGWVEVSDEIAREKVAMGFRNLSRKPKGQAGTKRKSRA